MSPIRVTCSRTIGMARNLYSTALAISGFLAAAAVIFAFGIESAEGGRLSLAAVWAASVSPVLPALAAFLAMDVWSDERQTGRVDMLLSVAVREREFVIGKFLGVWAMVLMATLLFMMASVAFLWWFSPTIFTGQRMIGFAAAFVALAIQSFLWCAISVALSALFCHAALAAGSAIVLMIVLPRGLWAAMMTWSKVGRSSFGEMPLDAHAIDFASGAFSSGAVLTYLILAVLMLFVASKAVMYLRLSGRGAVMLRMSTWFAVLLAFVAAALAIMLVVRLDVKLDMPVSSGVSTFSPRTRSILAESGGNVSVTLFLSRNDPRFRQIGHLLRAMKQEAEMSGDSRFYLQFVDPSWDIGAAERLIRRGVTEDSLVFEKGRRMTVLPLRDGYGERLCASAIMRLATSPQRRNVYWTIGHGESLYGAYDAFGMSDIARDITRDGYRNSELDISQDRPIPGDCALIVISGPKTGFSRVELGRLDAYLREGGRLLVMLNESIDDGLTSLLTTWGVRPVSQPIVGAKTLSGSDVIVSEFADHAISAPLRGSRIVLEHPVVFKPSSMVESGVGVDRVEFVSVASVGASAVAAVVERGAAAGGDLALRPTRIVAIGDARFVMNGELAVRANANRDFFLNCVAYLSGTDASSASGAESDLLVLGLDREDRIRHIVYSAGAFPGLVFLVMMAAVMRRRRRK